MTEYSDRFIKVADGFSRRVEAVPATAWDNPTPCEGWVARDVVRHLVEWVPGFFTGTAGLTFPTIPSADVDPVGAWSTLRAALEHQLADEPVATREIDAPMGRMSIEAAIDMIVTGDVLVHTWDLARATGLDETLDPIEVARMLEGIEPMDEVLRGSGHYGRRVAVPDDADTQTKLIAFVGRNPADPGR
ncbi:MAG: TIGR03086 family protein [Actinobacteria bacterium]|nr:TIGR03086 family protein [Actinomycetota bacterium]